MQALSKGIFCNSYEVGGKWCQHDSLELINDLHVPCVWIVSVRYLDNRIFFVDFMYLMKWRNHWLKFSLSIHSEEWYAWIDPGGVPFISFGLIYFLGNTRNGGMTCPVGLIELTNVTRIPDLRIEQKISDACFSILIFSCVCAVQ